MSKAWRYRRDWLPCLLFLPVLQLFSLVAAGQYVAPYCGIQGTLNSSGGNPAANATLSFQPSQVFFVAGSSVVVSESQCSTDVNGNVVGVGNPSAAPRVSVQYAGTLPTGNYYVKFTWYDQFGTQSLPSVEVAAQLTHTGELNILPPVGTGPPNAVGMAVYIGTASGAETLQGTTNTPTAQFTQAVPLGAPIGSITVTSGGQYPSCPTAFTFTGDGGTGASATPVCTASGGGFTVSGFTALIGGNNYTSAVVVGTNGTPSVAPVLVANLSPVNPPISNLTACRVVCNDAGFPTGTGYTVSLVDASGNTLFNYPEMWQFFGPGSTYNLSQGIPYYHGQVTYPIPVLTIPYNHNPQSISGPLSLSNYNLYNVAKVGVGTAMPAYGVDVEGAGLLGVVNAAVGFAVNGNPSAPEGDCLSVGTSGYYDTPIPCITSIGTIYYQRVALNGTTVAQQPVLNFLSPLVVTPVTGLTDIQLNKVGTGSFVPMTAGLGVSGNCAQWSVAGLADAGAPCPVAAFTGTSGYQTIPGGLILEWGTANPPTANAPYLQTLPFTFPHACFIAVATDNGARVSGVGGSSGNPSSSGAACNSTSSIYVNSQDTNNGGSGAEPVGYFAIGW